ncbi:unnamed protein product [Haemonchus placei]|uniref:Uncharacterized protein n=1 Tax=Haemonchus placei TaxID=6290 RepID=A0A0N4X4T0_HAEPC|nr:unnamed protein product [Haemonchus placei]
MCESCWQHAHVDLNNNNEHRPMVRSPPVRARFTTNNPSMQKEREASSGYSTRIRLKIVKKPSSLRREM